MAAGDGLVGDGLEDEVLVGDLRGWDGGGEAGCLRCWMRMSWVHEVSSLC